MELHREDTNGTRRTIFLDINPDGHLMMSTLDLGDAPRKVWGTDEYEFFVGIDAEQKDPLLLALIAERFRGRAEAVDEFREWLSTHDIPHEFHNWT